MWQTADSPTHTAGTPWLPFLGSSLAKALANLGTSEVAKDLFKLP